MDTVKRFAKYAILLILFWIISDILINVGIDSMYKDMNQKGNIPEGIQVVEVQSTKVNGRIKLTAEGENLSGKFIKVDLYSDIDNHLGTQYLEIGNLAENEIKNIETYFKISETKSYEISVVDEAGESTEGFMDTAMTAMTVLVLVIKFLFI